MRYARAWKFKEQNGGSFPAGLFYLLHDMTLQDFISTLETRLSALGSLQRETGIPSDLQESRLCNLFQQMLQIADNQLEECRKERDSTNQAIVSTTVRIAKLRRLMGENATDNIVQNENKQTLLERLHAAEKELAIIQNVGS